MNNRRCSEGPEEDTLAFFAKMQACANRRSELWNKVAAGNTEKGMDRRYPVEGKTADLMMDNLVGMKEINKSMMTHDSD